MNMAKNKTQLVTKGETINLSYNATFWKTKERFLIDNLENCKN